MLRNDHRHHTGNNDNRQYSRQKIAIHNMINPPMQTQIDLFLLAQYETMTTYENKATLQQRMTTANQTKDNDKQESHPMTK